MKKFRKTEQPKREKVVEVRFITIVENFRASCVTNHKKMSCASL